MPPDADFIPFAISWNITSRCNLACRHCYIDAGCRDAGLPGDLQTNEIMKILPGIASVNPGAVLILTGGEPMAHGDIYDICAMASSLGLMVVLGTNGTLLNPSSAKMLKECGVSGVGVSIDSLDEKIHDQFRGSPGSLKASMRGLLAARDAGLEIQVQTTAINANIDELPLVAEWAHKIGAKAFNVFFLVCTGRGQTMTDISPQSYEKVLKWASRARNDFPGMMVRPKCAPHFKRILYEEDKNHPLLSTYIAACRAGTQYCRIDPSGVVTPCPYMDVPAGDLRTSEFGDVWKSSAVLAKYRSPKLEGKCGLCGFRLLCGGCRARAYANLGDEMGEDAYCAYEPSGQEEAITSIDTIAKFGGGAGPSSNWSPEAEAIINKIPVFARSIVRLAVEKHAREHGAGLITPEVVKAAAPGGGWGRPQPANAPPSKKADEIPWDDEAYARTHNAPDFVRPGIYKLMQKRGAERGKNRIDDAFLSEIRDESMMLVSKRMKKSGFDELTMQSWMAAKDRFSKNPVKVETINRIVEFLDGRDKKNEAIISKFKSYLEDDSPKLGWSREAKERLNKVPEGFREMAKTYIEKESVNKGYRMITEKSFDEVMKEVPFAKFMGGGR